MQKAAKGKCLLDKSIKTSCRSQFISVSKHSSVMFKFLVLLFIPLVYGNLLDGWVGPGDRITRAGPVITLNQGRIRGLIERYDGSETFVCYRGIPYAERKLCLFSRIS